jgi:hypothetical protein
MVQALQEEIEKLEAEGQENADTKDVEGSEEVVGGERDVPVDDGQGDSEDAGESAEPGEDTQEEPIKPTQDEIESKQKAYKERQEQKKREAEERRQAELVAQADKAVETKNYDEKDAILAAAAQLVQKEQYNAAINAGERELKALEKDFVDAYPDYNEVVERALDATKMRLLSQGQDESEIDAYLRREKVLIADRAAAQGKDPVEAVYKEALGIVNWLDSYAEKMGYQKSQGKPKTNLQAIRDISKTPAVGTGRGTGAAKKTFDEMDDLEEIGQVTLGDLMSGNV